MWVYVKRPEDFDARVKPLLNIGALVRYPMGKGGVILNQVNVKDREAVPDNVQKKRVMVTTLLRNLHAVFAGGKVLTTANLKFQPVALGEQCNQYLTKDRGWYEGNRDLSHIPHGEVTLGGVTYLIRDFKTSHPRRSASKARHPRFTAFRADLLVGTCSKGEKRVIRQCSSSVPTSTWAFPVPPPLLAMASAPRLFWPIWPGPIA